MKRRDLIALVGGAAPMWPLGSRAQQLGMPVIGFLHSASADSLAFEVVAFRDGLREVGYVEGRNASFEFRWAEGQLDRLPALAADLVRRRVAVIAALGGDVTALAAKAATATIPIVFENGSDPIKSGLVVSLNHPGGNITGVSLFAGTLDAKRLELLHELLPQVGTVAVLTNQLVAETEARSRDLELAARALGLQLVFLNVSSERDFDPAFASITKRNAGALFVSGSPFFLIRRERLVALAAQQSVPTIYAWREFPAAGGLISYGSSLSGAARQAGIYSGRILGGEKSADLPVLQPTKFEMVINLRTASAQGVTVPPLLLARADEAIE